MKHALIGLAAAGAVSLVCAQSLNVRLGGWDMSMSFSGAGKDRDMEMTYKTCITKDDLDTAGAFQNDEDCRYKLTSRSSTRFAGTLECTGDTPMQGEFEILAPTPETITMKSRSTGGKEKWSMQISGRFANPSCKGYEN